VTLDQIPPLRVAELEDLVRYDTWGTFFLRLNATRPPFDRPGVRRAFARAIDRRKVAVAAGANPAERLVPAAFRGYPEVKGPGFDRAAAVEGLLRESEFDLSKFPRVEVLMDDGSESALVGKAVRDELEGAFGIAVRIRAMKWPAFLEAVRSGEYQVALGGWMGDSFDPSTFLECWAGGDPRNGTGWVHAGFEALLEDAQAEAGEKERMAALGRAEGLLLDEAPVIPLYSAWDGYLVSSRVSGLRPNLVGRFPLKHVRLSPR
jgi:oligopeptide transport system substrate-binding protein